MKKVFAILMMMIMLCAVALPVHAENEMAAGGWNTAEETVVTEEAAEALKKATEGLVGCAYEPVAVLGTQVVAGINYCILCKLTPVVPDAVPHYAFVYVWQKLDGTADLLGVKDIEPDMNAEAVGGWTAAEDPTVTEEAADALKKATAAILGVEFAPVAVIGTQVVAGINYCMIVRITPVAPNAEAHYGIMRVWQKLDGTAETLSIDDVQLWMAEEAL